MDPLVLEPPRDRPRRASTGLVVTTWNRPLLARLTLSSVARSALDDVAVIVVDDCSDDLRTLRLVRRFDVAGVGGSPEMMMPGSC